MINGLLDVTLVITACQCERQWNFSKIWNWLLYLKVWTPIKHTGHMTIIASNNKVLPPELLSEWKQWVMGRNVQGEKKAEISLSVCPTGKPCQRRKEVRFFQSWHNEGTKAASFTKSKLFNFYSGMMGWKAATFFCSLHLQIRHTYISS